MAGLTVVLYAVEHRGAVRRIVQLRPVGVGPRPFAWSTHHFHLTGDPIRVEQFDPVHCTMQNEWSISLSRDFNHGFRSVQRVQITGEQISRVDNSPGRAESVSPAVAPTRHEEPGR